MYMCVHVLNKSHLSGYCHIAFPKYSTLVRCQEINWTRLLRVFMCCAMLCHNYYFVQKSYCAMSKLKCIMMLCVPPGRHEYSLSTVKVSCKTFLAVSIAVLQWDLSCVAFLGTYNTCYKVMLYSSFMAIFTSIFSDSGVFTDIWIALLFC